MADTVAERKTQTPSASLTVAAKRIPLEEQKDLPPFVKGNVLNNYRSYTYNFTLAALSREQVADPESYRKKDYKFDFVILKSGGKGAEAFNSQNVSGVTVTKSFRAEGDSRTYETTSVDKEIGKSLVNDFNAKGLGRFDMYIDNIEVETLMAFTPGTNTSFGTKINFEVFEPYSINGFPQALHVGAVSSGYPSYLGASYVLVMEFIGYPDNKDISEPEPIEYSKRYFVVKFSKFDAEITERGTRYACSCIPINDSAFGTPNVLKDPIQIAGNTVGAILKNFEDSLNQQIKEAEKDYKPAENATRFDKYKILFGEIVDNKLTYEKNKNIFSESKVLELLREKSLYRFPDPGNSNQVATNQQRATSASYGTRDDPRQGRSYVGSQPAPNTSTNPDKDAKYVRYTPDTMAVQFSEKSRIHECIIAILRDCEYTRSILEKLDILLDENDMVDYFAVLTEVETDEIDPVTKRNFQTFKYIIVPHKIHFTRIPGYQGQKYDTSKLVNKALRNYNYIYSGSNQDLINFKLNFNTLFFEAIPKALAVSDYRFSEDSLGPSNESDPKFQPENIRNIQSDSIGTPPIAVNPDYQKISNIGIAGPTSVKPFDVLTRNMHESIINPKGSMLTGELEILGDPLYLTTSGQGNYKPLYITADSNLTLDGELSYVFREVYINIVFKNPSDIGINGMYVFEKDKVPFSGIYRVNKVKSHFRDGVFKQTLEVLRMPGQFVTPGIVQATDPAKKLEFEPNPYDKIVPDTTPSVLRPPVQGQGLNILQQIASLGNTITGVGASITGAIQDVTSGISQSLQSVRDKVTSSVSGISAEITSVATKLGITGSELQNATAAQLAQLALFAKTLPENVDPKAAGEQGVALSYIPVEKYQNIPPVAPRTSAPDVEVNQQDIQNLMKVGGAAALAFAYGVNNSNKIPGSQLNKSNRADLLTASTSPITNPLSSLTKQPTDSILTADKKLSAVSQVSNSVEVNLKVSGVSVSTDLNKTATAVYGSKIESPLTKYINRTSA